MIVHQDLRPLEGKLIVSCQADPGDAFYGQMSLFAHAAVEGGAGGIRANGPEDVRAIRGMVRAPVIGIQKRMEKDAKVLITPTFEDARALVEAGAAALALDCTKRGQATGALDRIRRIKSELHVPVLADIATVEEAMQAAAAGADAVLSTMRGYTDDTADFQRFEPCFIKDLVQAVEVPVFAEGRVDSPELARQAVRAGAFAVIVGSAITRPHLVTRWFVTAVENESAKARGRVRILGIDMGGTNTKSGLVSSDGKLLWEETVSTPAKAGREELLTHLVNVAARGMRRADAEGHVPAAIGLATAGWVDPFKGRVVYATDNLPGWTGTAISERLQRECGVPVYVENDANALAVGEAEFGAGRGLTDFVCITLGTGVGGGCWIDGRLRRGAHFFANALGHICIHPGGRACNCGQQGCLEVYTNAAALLEYSNGRYESNEALIEASHRGEEPSHRAIRTFAQHLAIGCGVLVQLLDPQALILAGGLVQNNPMLLDELTVALRCRISVPEQRNLRVIASELGYHAGVLGAAAVASQAG